MSLFQKSVINKYLKGIESAPVEEAWKLFTNHFHNPSIQENIRNAKEEQYQSGFLTDLFVKVFGYTLNPSPNFNLTTELKNVKGAKKTDGAILNNGKALAVIELKGMNTTDLAKVENQAFGYKNNQPGCNYVITSNFEKLRFYIDNAVEFEEFNLFHLTKERFDLLWICLSSDYLLKDIPKKIKDESLTQEENISKQLYKDYSLFRNEIFDSIQNNNPDYDKLTLFKKTQKLLDRFLFIFFAEDRLLVPPNSINLIIEKWKDDVDFGGQKSLYAIFQQYFKVLNVGRPASGNRAEIFAYNGGLFASDDILDNIKIEDNLLYKHTQKLSNYDFESEVSVNILGHIFEHSLNEIEEIQAELAGISTDKSKSKRKKDGVFYTPKYITKYIVDNTVGKLCEEQKIALAITESEYEKNRKGRKKATLKILNQKLEDYRNWLLELTVCDPACGSGAFLNQALEFLISEHRYIDELQTKLLGGGFVFPNVENTILENNLFGVDINEESVEIAKLSLWLRTAQKGRKLTSLNHNIKCGNSLIDDPEVAGDKAFNWEKEFPAVFEKGGFDVVIGNPPYVKRQNLSNENQILFLEKKYQSATYNFDLYLLFIEKGSQLIKKTGLVSYINPSKFTSTKTGKGIRNYLDSNCHILTYIDFKEYQIFADAITYCCIFILNNNNKGVTKYFELKEDSPQEIDSFIKYEIEIKDTSSGLGWQFKPIIEIKGSEQLKNFVQTFTGIESGADNLYILSREESILETFKSSYGKIVFPLIKGANVHRYFFEQSPYYAIVPYSENKKLLDSEFLSKNHPEVWKYLNEHKQALVDREKGKMNSPNWYGYVYPKNLYKYNNKRLIWTDISRKPQFVIDETKNWHVRTVCSLELNDKGINKGLSLKFLLSLLNSTLFFYFIKNNSNSIRGGYLRYKPQYVKEFPLPEKIDDNLILQLENTVTKISAFTKKNITSKINFQRYIQSQFKLETLSKKLQNWNELEFGDFIKELNKAIKKAKGEKLSKIDEFGWMEIFEAEKAKAQLIKSEIEKTDQEIDQMVYTLYGLTEEEIKIVEAASA